MGAGAAQASTTVTVAPNTPNANNDFPFGSGLIWPPFMGFVYKNVPAFQLKASDALAFDLSLMNDNDDQLDIALAPTTVNGGDVPAASFTTVVTNTQTPANPKGNTISGDYELGYTAQAPFSFPGGGLIIRFSNPGPALAADTTSNSPLQNGGDSSDSSGFFVNRFTADPDGVYPWTGGSFTYDIGAFRLTLADPPIRQPPAKVKAKCKKRKRASAAKKRRCKRKKRK